MTIHALRFLSAEYDDVKSELTMILEVQPPSGMPLPEGVREDLAVVQSGEVRIGPVRVSKNASPPIVCTWTDPDTLERWRATWNPSTQRWSAPVNAST